VEVMMEKYHPRRLAVFSRDEFKQHEMKTRFPDPLGGPMRYFLGDVRDYDRLRRAFQGVDVIIHAAAMKRVPAAEADPFEAVQTNIIGSKNVIEAAIDAGVKRVLALSTDKAVNPANLYGATKLVAEKLFTQGNGYSGADEPRFACTRYGNVMGSRGSVIPIFMKQRETGKLTVTDERMTRFWLSLERSVEIVVASVERMIGGEVFVPKIHEMRLMDLVEAIAPGCEVELTGIGPGEKLHETLISVDEANRTLEYDDYYLIQPSLRTWAVDPWQGGKSVEDGFQYSSDSGMMSLSREELARNVEGL
jgi:UDP-N-acetylglucosamine 4,6-dehydratase